MADAHHAYDLLPRSATNSWKLAGTFSTSVGAISVALLAALCAVAELAPLDDAHVARYYSWFIHVMIMVFCGFGFLMSFLKKYSYSAIGINFFASSIVMLVFVVAGGAVQQVGGPHLPRSAAGG